MLTERDAEDDMAEVKGVMDAIHEAQRLLAALNDKAVAAHEVHVEEMRVEAERIAAEAPDDDPPKPHDPFATGSTDWDVRDIMLCAIDLQDAEHRFLRVCQRYGTHEPDGSPVE